ncbi:MAG: hypothetical protein DKM50_12020 [Candidatus Margulisiibacteriota bacterium]|nr:MAG: hypothetical protein A2X43_04560 [Candidatus Margulisbacteria bacterium GWD2_39_127]OGI01584.1 MAG: hypothetical protein A2X42_08390 [Candidatus Margulisbacteria bacterium GWF2_38_17]OGI10026.1 MAG: hypothetical protein A2X41_09100 [Candidatus Margulisbacteria bacterium GWE2_39_32]PZM78281.1 MAG: hypothetical protein DKM50_12020 [Candidatus Margulisiibacteriota bacterium]HAR61831.1 hypothetical protein [Candidatus Margulisiibacteriota bacterium]
MNKIIARHYDKNVELFGNDFLALGWASIETQQVRFDTLTTIADLNNSHVLDVGCGLGDLCKYLNEYYEGIKYTGIDVSSEMISCARENHPGSKFLLRDLNDDDNEEYDYAFASGSFNIKVGDNYNYLDHSIERMWEGTSKGIAFNILSSYAPEKMKDDFFFYYQPEKVFTLCSKYTQYIIVRHDYLPNDVTYILKK